MAWIGSFLRGNLLSIAIQSLLLINGIRRLHWFLSRYSWHLKYTSIIKQIDNTVLARQTHVKQTCYLCFYFRTKSFSKIRLYFILLLCHSIGVESPWKVFSFASDHIHQFVFRFETMAWRNKTSEHHFALIIEKIDLVLCECASVRGTGTGYCVMVNLRCDSGFNFQPIICKFVLCAAKLKNKSNNNNECSCTTFMMSPRTIIVMYNEHEQAVLPWMSCLACLPWLLWLPMSLSLLFLSSNSTIEIV